MKVAVVGAGAAGLSAAFELMERGVEPAVFEAEARAGGKVGSAVEQGFLTENGPNALSRAAVRVGALAARLHLGGEIREAPRSAARWVYRAGRLRKAPGPALLSWSGWLRALCEPLAPGRPLTADRPLRELLVERLGEEAGGLAAELMARGVYSGDPRRLSARDAFPSLGKLASRNRSLLLAALSRPRPPKGAEPPATPPARSLWSFSGGLGSFTERLAAALGAHLRLEARVTALTPDGEGLRIAGPWGSERFDAVVLAVPAFAAAELVRGFAASLADALGAIPYAPVAVVHLGVREADLAVPAHGFGLLAADGALSLLGTLFPASLFPGRAPEGHALLTSMVGGAGHPELAGASASRLVEACRDDLGRAMGLSAEPVYSRVVRHERAIPQVEVGHADRLRAIVDAARPWPRLALCGAAYRGVSVDAAAQDGFAAARRILGG